MCKQRVLYVTAKWPGKTQSNDGGDSTLNEVIRALSSTFSLDLLCFRDDVSDLCVDGVNKVFLVEEDFANFKSYSDRRGKKFYKRIEQAKRAAYEIRKIEHEYKIIIVQHVSLIMGLNEDKEILKKIVLFPMFTSISYERSGEFVPEDYKLSERQAIQNVYKIVSPSYVERDLLVSDCGVDNDVITVIPRAVRKGYRERKKCNKQIRLVYIASVRLQKNHMAALRVLNEMKKRSIDAFLTCVGAIQDKTIYKDCIEFINSNGLAGNISFIGNASPDEVDRILNDSDINISVSNWETFGRGIYEGMAKGLPTVIFDKIECVVNANNIGVYPIIVETEKQMVNEIIRLAKDANYYSNESQKGLGIENSLDFSKIKSKLQSAIVC